MRIFVLYFIQHKQFEYTLGNNVVIINMVIRSGMQRMYLLGRKYYIKRNELIVLYTNASNIHAFKKLLSNTYRKY